MKTKDALYLENGEKRGSANHMHNELLTPIETKNICKCYIIY